jgi:hypothetical protein
MPSTSSSPSSLASASPSEIPTISSAPSTSLLPSYNPTVSVHPTDVIGDQYPIKTSWTLYQQGFNSDDEFDKVVSEFTSNAAWSSK